MKTAKDQSEIEPFAGLIGGDEMPDPSNININPNNIEHNIDQNINMANELSRELQNFPASANYVILDNYDGLQAVNSITNPNIVSYLLGGKLDVPPTELFNKPPEILCPYDITLSKTPDESFGVVVISSVAHTGSSIGRIMEGSPAEKSGKLHVGDRILGVNNVDTSKLHHSNIISLIKRSGLNVTLTVESADAIRSQLNEDLIECIVLNPVMGTPSPPMGDNVATSSGLISPSSFRHHMFQEAAVIVNSHLERSSEPQQINYQKDDVGSTRKKQKMCVAEASISDLVTAKTFNTAVATKPNSYSCNWCTFSTEDNQALVVHIKTYHHKKTNDKWTKEEKKLLFYCHCYAHNQLWSANSKNSLFIKEIQKVGLSDKVKSSNSHKYPDIVSRIYHHLTPSEIDEIRQKASRKVDNDIRVQKQSAKNEEFRTV